MYIKTGIVLALMSSLVMANSENQGKSAVYNNSGNYFFSPFLSKTGEASKIFEKGDNLAFGFDAGVIHDGEFGYRAHFERLNFNETGSSIGGDYLHFVSDNAYAYGGVRMANIDGWELMPAAGAGYDLKIGNSWSIRAESGAMHSFKQGLLYPNILLGVLYRFGDRDSYVSTQSPDIIPVYRDEPVRIKINVQFEHDSSVIKSIYESDIEKVANFLGKYKNTEVSFEGHTSSVGSDKYNMDLSQKRADAVADLLIDSHQIDKERVSSIGFGEYRLLVEENSKEDEAINRRVTAVLESR